MERRILRIFLVALMLLFVQACASNEETPADQTEDTTTEETTDTAETTDTSETAEEEEATESEVVAEEEEEAEEEEVVAEEEETTEVVDEPTVFIMCVNNQPNNVDPHVGSSNPEQEIITAGYETLIGYEPGGYELSPLLATAWEYNDDATELTLQIREGVQFHDGSMLDSAAVKAALERSMAIGQGESFFLDPVESIDAPDEQTVVINLSQSSPEFILGLTRIFISSQQAMEEHETDGDLAQNWFGINVAGTGPYPMTNWEQGQSITASRFEDYWQGWEGEHIDEYQLRVVAEPATQRLLIERGECDYADSITRDDVATLSSNPDIKIEEHAAPSPFYIAMNTQSGPLTDVRVREAVQHALDYEGVIEEAMSGYASKMWGPLPQQFPQHLETLAQPEYDLERAAALLGEAGYEPGELELDFMYLEPWIHERNTGLVLQSALAEIGVTLNMEPQPWATIVERHANPDTRPDMSMYTVFAPTPSPYSIFYPMFQSGSNHWSYFGYSNEEVDQLLAEVPTITDNAEREEAYKELQQVLYDDHPSIYAFLENEVQVFDSSVQGYVFRPAWNKLLPYYNLYKE